MRKTGLATALAAVAFAMSAWGQEALAPVCHLKRVAYLDMTFNQAGQPSIPVVVNGKGATFFVDTAGISGIMEKTTEAMGLKKAVSKYQPVAAAYGVRIRYAVFPEAFQIGIVPLPGIRLMVIPPEVVDEGAGDVGSIGTDVLQLFDVEFDFAAAKFSLFMPSACGEKVVHWPHGDYGALAFSSLAATGDSSSYIIERKNDWHIVVPGQLDGVDVDVTVDTGSTVSFMTIDDAKMAIPTPDQDKMVRINPLGAPEKATYTYPFKTLTLGALKVKAPIVHLWPNKLGNEQQLGKLKPHLVLGMSALRQLHLYVAYKDRKVYFTSAEGN